MRKYFITCNTNKFNEIKSYIPNLEQLCVEKSIEVQSLESKYIIREKLFDAKDKSGINDGILIVEDTGLYLKALNNFPGPLIKFLLKSVKSVGIYELCKALNNYEAYAKTIFGLFNNATREIKYFEGIVKGVISEPKGENGFGWDPIFIPDGSQKTFAEIETIEEKNKFSMRTIALNKLLEKLNNI